MASSNNDPLDLTIGIELEFICVYKTSWFGELTHSDNDSIRYRLSRYIADVGELPTMSLGDNIQKKYYNDDRLVESENQFQHWYFTSDSTIRLRGEEAATLSSGLDKEYIEISSRKLSVADDDWQLELRNLLKAMRSFEEENDCRFLTNSTTGMHVHIGAGDRDNKIPFLAARNVLEIVTAFEHCIDQMHTSPRIRIPNPLAFTGAFCAPPSFFSKYRNEPRTQSTFNLFNHLASVVEVSNYGELKSLFIAAVTDPTPGYLSNGHDSAYNFDQLLYMPTVDPPAYGTIEFRQHKGTLDQHKISAWVSFLCSLVQFAHKASDMDMFMLCSRAADPHFDLEDLLVRIDCSASTIAHYSQLSISDTRIGVVGTEETQRSPSNYYVELIDTNERQQKHLVSLAEMEKAMEAKDYGLYHKVTVKDINREAMEETFNQNLASASAYRFAESDASQRSWARKNVYTDLANLYRTVRESGEDSVPYLELEVVFIQTEPLATLDDQEDLQEHTAGANALEEELLELELLQLV